MSVVGVDGCSGGWIAIEVDGSGFQPRFHSSFADLIVTYSHADCIAVDVPIGLSSDGSRSCDTSARRALGSPRGASVFPAPDPRLLDCDDYEAANARSRELSGKGLSRQSFAIFGKVKEVNDLMTPPRQQQIMEVHPEVCFWAMSGDKPMRFSKRKSAGFEERRDLLLPALGLPVPDRRHASGLRRESSADDVLDALAAAWTARRVVDGIAQQLPAETEHGDGGIRMAITY